MSKKRFTILSPDEGERQIVASLDGYEGWTVELEEAGKDPGDIHSDDEFDPAARAWKRSAEKKRQREASAALRDPDAIDARFKVLEDRIAELERLAGTRPAG